MMSVVMCRLGETVDTQNVFMLQAAEAKYRRAYDEVVKYGNKALCFDVLGGISHLLFIAAIVTGILLILHYVANAF